MYFRIFIVKYQRILDLKKLHISMVVDSNIMKKTGRILIAHDLGEEYGFVDINGEMNLAYFVKNIQTDLGGSVYIKTTILTIFFQD